MGSEKARAQSSSLILEEPAAKENDLLRYFKGSGY